VNTAGYDIYTGDSNATQQANSTATTDVSNESDTDQHQKLDQSFGCGCDRKHDKGYSPRGGNTYANDASEASKPDYSNSGDMTSPNKWQRQED
jgi:hypothetical protein